ncbi:McrB family protein [Blautia sp.]
MAEDEYKIKHNEKYKDKYKTLLVFVNDSDARKELVDYNKKYHDEWDKKKEKPKDVIEPINGQLYQIINDIKKEIPGFECSNYNRYKESVGIREKFDITFKYEKQKKEKEPKSICIYIEKNPPETRARIYVFLSINPMAKDRKKVDEYYRFLDLKYDKSFFQYVVHYNSGNEKFTKHIYHEIYDEDIVDVNKYDNKSQVIELCHIIDDANGTKSEEEISEEVKTAVKKLLPYYDYTLGKPNPKAVLKESTPEVQPDKTAEENTAEENTSADISSIDSPEKSSEAGLEPAFSCPFDHNLILYGPPGTGKTYKTVYYAVSICTGESLEESLHGEYMGYEDVKKGYDELENEGRICFTTFHQSYNYEDFVEGIRPVLNGKSPEGKPNEEPNGKMKEELNKKPNEKPNEKPEENTEHQSLKYKVEAGIFKKFCEEAAKHKEKNYVFIIDEINRGNVSEIFGELMTLIETSKRDTASVILPNSRESFTVPSNVYLIGTMNTADRSLTALDAALRRRFSFEEIMPEPEMLREMKADSVLYEDVDGQTGKVDVVKILETINKRIEFLLDRDHTIGHAYFNEMCGENATMENLEKVFRNKIFPLLQEYFFDDYGKIHMILGDNGKPSKYQFVQKKYLTKNDSANENEYRNPFMEDYDRTGYAEDIYELPEVRYEINWEAFQHPVSYVCIYQKYAETLAEN